MDLLLQQVEPIIMFVFCQPLIVKNSRLPQALLCIVIVIPSLIFFHHNLMQPFKWCKFNKNQMSHSLILEVVINKNNKWDKQSSFLWHIQNYIHKLVLIHQKVYWCMDLQVQERQWWLKLSLILLLPHSSESLARNSFKNIWAKDQEWSEMSLNLPKKINLLSCLLIKSILLLLSN